jgi:glycosyltransferase involved in cell wall biosynthesis
VTSSAPDSDAIQLAPREVLFEAGALPDAEATVCITLYDYGAYVLEALETVYEQTLAALAVVVLDDGSKDDGPARVERWMRRSAPRFAGVCLARHTSNQGLARARNGAIDTARSPFVMVLDADNHLLPRCVERLLRSLEASACGFAYPILERFGELQGLMGTSSWSVELLETGNYVDAMALLRKSTWQRVGGYQRMQVGGWEDYDLWCRCVEAGIEGLFVPEILARYRMHRSSMLATETERGENSARVRREMKERHPWLQLAD